MTSRYRVEYALKSHKRDELIEWIKGLLAVPFVLHGNIDAYESYLTVDDSPNEALIETFEKRIEKTLQTRYLEVFDDVEKLIDNTIDLDSRHSGSEMASTRLRQLVPSVGRFFTRLPLKQAFLIEDQKRSISRRTLVSPSFNDIRIILNTAQVLALTGSAGPDTRLRLITFDGDVTLYEDGKSLEEDSPLVDHLVNLLGHNVYVAVVTAAGYPGQQGAESYEGRLKGLISTLQTTSKLSDSQKNNFLVMGGESNYLFRFDSASGHLKFINGEDWYLPLMKQWSQTRVTQVMDIAHDHIIHLQKRLRLDNDNMTKVIRKERSLGIIPVNDYKIQRETLEEMVLSVSQKLNEFLANSHVRKSFCLDMNSDCHPASVHAMSAAESDIRVCAFNGGADVWVDIGDKSLGVEALQYYLYRQEHGDCTRIPKSSSLHIGDQFASVGANDYKARLSACTVWIANPRETKDILDDLTSALDSQKDTKLDA